jgi:hypothetical protein
MKKRWIFLIAITTLLLGFLSGGWAGIRYWQSVDEERMVYQFLSDAKTHITLLTDLQNSNQKDAVLLLENKLDADVIGIYSMLESPDLKCEISKLLSSIAQYRKSTKYRSTRDKVPLRVNQVLEKFEQPNTTFKREPLRRAP